MVSGNGARLPHLANRVARSLNTRVEPVRVLDHLSVGRLQMTETELLAYQPVLPAAVGLGLWGSFVVPPSNRFAHVADRARLRLHDEGGRAMRPINLLPPEVAHERSRRRRAAIAIFGALAYVFLLGVGVLYWNSRVDAAHDDLDAQVAINQSLEREVAALAGTADIRTQYEEKAKLVRSALAVDIDWGIFLNDLARLLPPRVWVETFNGSVVPETIPGVIGQVSFSGVGFDFPDVSAWLRALDSDQFSGITGPWVSTVSQGIIGEDDVVTFSSTAVLTVGAATDRAETLIPEVP